VQTDTTHHNPIRPVVQLFAFQSRLGFVDCFKNVVCISLRRQYSVVVHALERLQNQGDDKVGQFLTSIMRFQFIIALVIAEHILHSTVYLSTFLQDTDYDILEAIEESNTVIEMLRAERQDESV
jgi:hypothetical protein